MTNKKILVAVESISDAFENKLTNKSDELFYIKTSDLKDWVEDQIGNVSINITSEDQSLLTEPSPGQINIESNTSFMTCKASLDSGLDKQ